MKALCGYIFDSKNTKYKLGSQHVIFKMHGNEGIRKLFLVFLLK